VNYIALTTDALRQVYPKAPPAVIAAFVAKQDVLDRAGVNHTRNRLSFALANVEHECAGFTHLRENINYTAERACQVWPNRFKSTGEVYSKTGSYPGDPEFRNKLIDSVYGGRMGNRPGTHDGSLYIGRGGPQITGRDGYQNAGIRGGVDFASDPAKAERAEYQPELLAGFIDWKGLNTKADLGDFKGYVKGWNGGQIGLADREHLMAGNDPFLNRLSAVEAIKPVANDLPGEPPTKEPPKEAIDAATKKERAARAGGAVSGAGGGAGEVSKKATQTGTVQPDKAPSPVLHPAVTWTLIGVGLAAIIVATILIARKAAIVKANWK
jgi:predicted chitinase